MNGKKNSSIHAALAVSVALIVAAFSFAVIYGAGGTSTYLAPSIFINDEPYRYDDNTPLLMIDGEYYVPAGIFSMLGITIESNNDIDSFVLYRREFGVDSYISFITDKPEAVTSEYGRIAVPPPRTVGATQYIPLEITCLCLSVSYDVSTEYPELSDYSVAIRIFDGSAQLTMPQLLKTYNKAAATVTVRPPVQSSSESSSSGSQTTPEPPDEANRVFLFISPEENGVDAVLSVLAEYGVHAAIFVDRDFVEAHPEKAADITASGNTLGILVDYAVRNDDEIKTELNGANDVILYAVKRASRLVLYGYDNDEFRIAAASDIGAVKRAGYDLVIPDICFGNGYSGIPARELRVISERNTVKIEISGANTLIYLRDVLDGIFEYYGNEITVVLPTEVSV